MIKKNIVFYSHINGVGSSTIAYQLARLLRLPFIQEQKNDLVFFLKNKLDTKLYAVKQLEEYNARDYKFCIFDLKEPHRDIFNIATDIVILTNNSHIDILKVIATLHRINSVISDKNKKIHVVFNRLQLGVVNREKKYTQISEKLISKHKKGLNVIFSYIRTNLIYYRQISEGHFFMDSFFKRDTVFLSEYPLVRDVPYTEYLKMFYNNQYCDEPYSFEHLNEYDDVYYGVDPIVEKMKYKESENPPTANSYIVNKNFHQKNIRLGKTVLRDMYTFLYNLGEFYTEEPTKKEYVQYQPKAKNKKGK